MICGCLNLDRFGKDVGKLQIQRIAGDRRIHSLWNIIHLQGMGMPLGSGKARTQHSCIQCGGNLTDSSSDAGTTPLILDAASVTLTARDMFGL